MKRTFVKIASKKFVTATAIAALLSITALNNVKAGETTVANAPVVYSETVNNNVLFNIKYANPTGSDFSMVVKNESGEVIYAKHYSDKNFSKRVLINELPEEGGNVTFIIKSNDGDLKQSFNISTSTKTVEDVTVTTSK